jgi:hypothetical protein
MENTKLQLSDLKVSNLPELQGWKEKQEKLVSENPYVEIVDNKSYESACKSRTALLKGRTELEKQDKLIAKKLTDFRKEVKSETETLIAITLPFEEKQQTEVKRYEAIKEAEKEEKARLEQERIDAIKKRIDDFETASFKIIQETTFENVKLNKSMLDALVTIDFDFEEYELLFEQVRSRIQSSWDLKCSDIQEKEDQRLANEKLEKENQEIKRLADLQAERLKEILPYIAFGEAVDLTKLSELEQTYFDSIIVSKKALFEAEEERKQEEIDKLVAEKKKIAEMRKNRLLEIGMFYCEERKGFWINENPDYFLWDGDAFEMDAFDFETLITEIKRFISKAKEDLEADEKQKAIDLQLAEEDAERLKQQNAERVAKYSNDKKVLKEFVNSLEFRNPVPELDNVESEETLNTLIIALEDFRKEWINNVEII